MRENSRTTKNSRALIEMIAYININLTTKIIIQNFERIASAAALHIHFIVASEIAVVLKK
jgi:hypothetical protein